MAASVLTLYCDNPEQSGSSAGLLALTAPTASTSTTGWTVGDAGAATCSRQSFRQEKARTTFVVFLQPDSAPLGKAEDCWRLSAATTGDFSAGTWYSSVSVIAVSSGGDQDGRARIRLWRSANADGTTATELTGSTMVGSNVTNLATTVAQGSSASIQIGAVSLTNEYLFMQVAWQNNSVVATNARDVLVRVGPLARSSGNLIGSGLETPLFTAAAGGAEPAGGGYLYRRRRDPMTGAS